MPLDTSDFPEDVQVAFFMLSLLPDKWDTMGGLYMGKDWSSIQIFMDFYEIESRRTIFFIMKLYETLLMNYRAEKKQEEQKREDARSKAKQAAGKNYAYNVKG